MEFSLPAMKKGLLAFGSLSYFGLENDYPSHHNTRLCSHLSPKQAYIPQCHLLDDENCGAGEIAWFDISTEKNIVKHFFNLSRSCQFQSAWEPQ